MRLIELITDCTTGNLSHTKIWTNVAYFAATIAFMYEAIFSGNPFSWEMWLIYLGTLGGHNVLSKLLSMKYGAKNDT